jgi:predicted aldo/keto reductase-like oxidoreductase
MPLHISDPSYLSFEQIVLPEAVKQGLGIQAMKTTANAKLFQSFSVKDCLRYVLSLPVHCATLGCTLVGQIEDDVRIAQQFRPLSAEELTRFRQEGKKLAGPALEDWKRDTQRASAPTRVYRGG